jgi:hypothetical protein
VFESALDSWFSTRFDPWYSSSSLQPGFGNNLPPLTLKLSLLAPKGSVPGQTLILLLSFRRHDMFGIGLPIALHVNVTRIPSVARVSELLESSNISGGTTTLI